MMHFPQNAPTEEFMQRMREWRMLLWDASIPEIARAVERTGELATTEAWDQPLNGYTRCRGETLLRELVAMVFIKVVLWSNEAQVYGGYVELLHTKAQRDDGDHTAFAPGDVRSPSVGPGR